MIVAHHEILLIAEGALVLGISGISAQMAAKWSDLQKRVHSKGEKT